MHPTSPTKHKLKSMQCSCLGPRGWPALDTTELPLARPLQTFRTATNYIADRQLASIGPGNRSKRLSPLLRLYLLAKLGCKCYYTTAQGARALWVGLHMAPHGLHMGSTCLHGPAMSFRGLSVFFQSTRRPVISPLSDMFWSKPTLSFCRTRVGAIAAWELRVRHSSPLHKHRLTDHIAARRSQCVLSVYQTATKLATSRHVSVETHELAYGPRAAEQLARNVRTTCVQHARNLRKSHKPDKTT